MLEVKIKYEDIKGRGKKVEITGFKDKLKYKISKTWTEEMKENRKRIREYWRKIKRGRSNRLKMSWSLDGRNDSLDNF